MIPFNKPRLTGRECQFIQDAVAAGQLAGNGRFTHLCQQWLQERLGAPKALLTHSCTGALEMAAILAGLEPGDEVIMPSFTFVSTANAFVLRGARPVFVDVRPDTLNLDERLVERAITSRTRAIVVVHYAGVPCAMDEITAIAKARNLLVIEDAAQALLSRYRDRPLGSLGSLAAISFHETKNIIAGEGGALIVNDPRFIERADVVWEKGTNRTKFFRGEIDRYTWMDIGSSYLPSEVTAAFLWSQLQEADPITAERRMLWREYDESIAALLADVRRPVIPAECEHNAHLYYVLLPAGVDRDAVLRQLANAGVHAVFHYVPLHSSPAGRRYGRADGSLAVTDDCSSRLIRLPLWPGMPPGTPRVVAERLAASLKLSGQGPVVSGHRVQT
jgi:dTDP-4-amino-4,6-dideoxygalactose transaminase